MGDTGGATTRRGAVLGGLALGGLALAAVAPRPAPAATAAPPPTRSRALRLLPGRAAPARCAWGVLAAPAPADAFAHAPAFRFAATFPGGAVRRVLLPTHYGRARLASVVEVAGRQVAVLAAEGRTGTGTYQEFLVLAGCDDAGALRLLAVETHLAREEPGCSERHALRGRVAAEAGGAALLVTYRGSGGPGDCAPPRGRAGRAARWSERWTDRLPWDGSGAIPAPAPDAPPGSVRRSVQEARARSAAWLAEAPRDRLDGDAVWRAEGGVAELLLDRPGRVAAAPARPPR